MGISKEERIKEIEQRIKGLEEHKAMWLRAGGVGGRMASDAVSEIKELELEKEDLINGTNNLEISRCQSKLAQLKRLRESANFIKKIQYNRQIKTAEAELQALQCSHNR